MAKLYTYVNCAGHDCKRTVVNEAQYSRDLWEPEIRVLSVSGFIFVTGMWIAGQFEDLYPAVNFASTVGWVFMAIVAQAFAFKKHFWGA